MTQPVIPYPAPPRRSNGLGVAGFVVSLVGVFTLGLLCPVGLLLSLMALLRSPRGFAFAGVVIGLLGTIFLAVMVSFFGFAAFSCFNLGSRAMATIKAPANATHDFIHAAAAGDEAGALAHSGLSDDELKAAETIIRAQGDFIDTTFNNININEGGSGHVEGTAQFKKGSLHIRADLTNASEGWKITSIELLPLK